MNAKFVLKIGLFVAGVVLLLVLLFAPAGVKLYVNKHGKTLTGRSLHIEKLRYNYFSSKIKVVGFTLFEADDSSEFLGFDTLLVNLRPLRFFQDELHVQQLLLVNPRGQVLQNDTVFNFSDLILEDTVVQNEQEDTAAETYKFNLNNLEMRNGNFLYADQVLKHSIKFRSISFKIPQIHWNASDSSKAGLEFELADGGHFAASLNYQVATGDFHGNVLVTGMAVKTLLPYMQQYMRFSAVEGTLSTKLALSGSVENTEGLTLSGSVTGNNLAFFDEKGAKVLGAENAQVALKSIYPLQDNYEIEHVQLNAPYVYFALIDSLSNLEMLLVDEAFETDSGELDGSQDSELYYRINRFVINDGLVDFSDQRFSNEFQYELSEIVLDTDTLAYEDDWLNLNATMKLNQRGKLEATLGLNPVNYMDSMQLDYVITDFQLPDLNIYSKHYVGLPILFGDMYYVSSTSMVRRQLRSENELIIRNVDMGRKTGGIYDVPVKLALFILKDINGDIVLDVPVKGDFDDPKTRFGPIVFNTLKNFMFKIVASPFKALGNALGADSDEISHLDFAYTDTALNNKQTKTLQLLLQLEKQKPELQADLMYYNDKQLEQLDAAREIAHRMYAVETGKKAESNLKNYMKYLGEKTGKDSLVMQDYEVLLALKPEVDSILQVRESLRFAMVEAFLKAEHDSTTIRLQPYQNDEVLNKGSRPHFEVKINLNETAE